MARSQLSERDAFFGLTTPAEPDRAPRGGQAPIRNADNPQSLIGATA
jgi:hypothetical protein